MLDNAFLPSATQLASVARALCEQGSEPEARQLLVAEAVALCGCTAAAFARRMPSGAVELSWGGPAELAEQLAGLIRPTGELLAALVLDEQRPVTSELTTETRWPDYAAALVRHSPIRSVQAHPVRLADNDLGALVLYASEDGYSAPERCRPGAMLAEHAAIGLSLLQNRHRAEHLAVALESSREIGQAMGILMATHKVTSDRAFDLLRTASQHGHIKLREVAREVTMTGQLPQQAVEPAI